MKIQDLAEIAISADSVPLDISEKVVPGAISVISTEPQDEPEGLREALGAQERPVVILVSGQTRALQSPADFEQLKLLRRQRDLSITFVIPRNSPRTALLTSLAAQKRFPVYASWGEFVASLSQGRLLPDSEEQHVLGQASSRALQASGEPESLLGPAPFSPTQDVPWAGLRSSVSFELPESLQNGSAPPWETSEQNAASLIFPPAPQSDKHRRSPRKRLLVPVLLLVLVLVSALVVARFLVRGVAPTAGRQVAGRMVFLSSGQTNESTNQGIADQVEINLGALAAPAAGRAYYAWLLPDASAPSGTVILLGKLTVEQGRAALRYNGDAVHSNLLALASRFLVTEEEAAITPLNPSPDKSTWRYYAEIPQVRAPGVEFSLLDHLRHLLADDPKIRPLGLSGGLAIWLFRNSEHLFEEAVSAQGYWHAPSSPADLAFMRRQAIRILDYLDSPAYIGNDVPPGTPLLVDRRFSGVALLEFSPTTQSPPGYLYHIERHLAGIVAAPGADATMRSMAAKIDTALNQVNVWLEEVRRDARALVAMSDDQLAGSKGLALLNDMATLANDAYSGLTDPATNRYQGGVEWIYTAIQSLATLDVSSYTGQTPSSPDVPGSQAPQVPVIADLAREAVTSSGHRAFYVGGV